MSRFAPADTPIRIVCATRVSKQQFIAGTQTGRSLAAFRSTSIAEVSVYANNSSGLSEVYNHAIEAVRDDPRILVFVHDDCLIADYFWTERVREGLRSFDAVGVVGNTRRSAGQASWIIVDPTTGRQDDYAHLSGSMGQGMNFPPEQLHVFGPAHRRCTFIDGVFIACYSAVLHQRALRFDPAFAFHFYDMDFCRSAELLDVSIGTIPLSLVHASLGSLDGRWRAAYAQYLAKWKE